jgi:hypothetical protein
MYAYRRWARIPPSLQDWLIACVRCSQSRRGVVSWRQVDALRAEQYRLSPGRQQVLMLYEIL